ncbi:lysophospholipid acyltransferase family protein [Hahella sp. SMD15-11]|uniref:Lysophospholipid acyltransferase family protein n=1 Tax=Thermohahella caldifontis TaxID=3142973 RepID=A0AB39UXG7_9GAMM
MTFRTRLKQILVPTELDKKLDTNEKPIGEMGYDPWGFNLETFKIAAALFKPFYERYFRTEAKGVENVPASGPVLIIANHSGQLPIDGLLIGYALATREDKPRTARAMIERFFPTVPWLGNLLNQCGAVLGDPVNCSKMLQRDEAIIVFPEGIRGSGKLYKDRYQLKRFGHGFMHLAIQHKAPIVPVGVVGCEETIPAIGNIKPLARMLGVPYVPVALPAVLPAKVILNFGEPMYFEGEDLTEAQVAEYVAQVKAEISRLIDKGLAERDGVF